MSKLSVFLGLLEVAGYYENLKVGLRDLGYKVTYVDLSDHPFRYADQAVGFVNLLMDVQRRYRQSTVQFGRLGWGLLSLLGRLCLLCWTTLTCDVFVFSFGQSFFWNHELGFLKLFGKQIICFVAHGSEARPPYLDGAHLFVDGSQRSFYDYLRQVKAMKRNLSRIEKYADYLICSQQTDHFLRRPYIGLNFVGIPYYKESQSTPEPISKSGAVRILHAPSNEIVKGTTIIRETIQRLMARGYAIQFVEISGQPNAVVMLELSKCDFVVDQLYSDTPLAGFACEAAWFGKPAVVGGYAWDTLRSQMPSQLFPVSEVCHPNDLETAIEHLIADRNYRLDLGRRAKAFVESQWNRKAVAARFAQIIRGAAPEAWICDPLQHPVHVHGCGLSESRAKEIIQVMLRGGGVSALGLSDKPDAEQQLVQFADQLT